MSLKLFIFFSQILIVVQFISYNCCAESYLQALGQGYVDRYRMNRELGPNPDPEKVQKNEIKAMARSKQVFREETAKFYKEFKEKNAAQKTRFLAKLAAKGKLPKAGQKLPEDKTNTSAKDNAAMAVAPRSSSPARSSTTGVNEGGGGAQSVSFGGASSSAGGAAQKKPSTSQPKVVDGIIMDQ